MLEFYRTPAGRIFFDRDVPGLKNALERISFSLEKITIFLEKIVEAQKPKCSIDQIKIAKDEPK